MLNMKFSFFQILILGFSTFLYSPKQSYALEDLYSKISPSCLEILVGGRLDGSGVIVDEKGLVMTALHVIRSKPEKIEALSRSLGRLKLKVVATNRGSDLALLSLPKKKEGYPKLTLAGSVPIEGTQVFLIGSPIFRHHLLLTGTVARRKESFSWYDQAFTNTFTITGISAPGTSGGPWVNKNGEIFAIQVAGVTTEAGHQGVNSAVGLPSIKSLIEKRETVTIPTIQAAVEELWGQSPFLINQIPDKTKGLLFRQVSPSGVCGQAGISDEDIMLSANGKTYQRIEPFIKYIRYLSIGSEIKFSICNFEGENIRTIAINLAELK